MLAEVVDLTGEPTQDAVAEGLVTFLRTTRAQPLVDRAQPRQRRVRVDLEHPDTAGGTQARSAGEDPACQGDPSSRDLRDAHGWKRTGRELFSKHDLTESLRDRVSPVLPNPSRRIQLAEVGGAALPAMQERSSAARTLPHHRSRCEVPARTLACKESMVKLSSSGAQADNPERKRTTPSANGQAHARGQAETQWPAPGVPADASSRSERGRRSNEPLHVFITPFGPGLRGGYILSWRNAIGRCSRSDEAERVS